MSEVTLDELLEEVGLTSHQLDEKCTSQHLQDIALFLESWRTLAPRLGLSSGDVESIEAEAHSEQERKHKTLELWKTRSAFKAKYRVLVETLLKVGNADQAEKVCRLLTPHQPSEDVSKLFRYLLMYTQ